VHKGGEKRGFVITEIPKSFRPLDRERRVVKIQKPPGICLPGDESEDSPKLRKEECQDLIMTVDHPEKIMTIDHD
jgi:hypothetical protein